MFATSRQPRPRQYLGAEVQRLGLQMITAGLFEFDVIFAGIRTPNLGSMNNAVNGAGYSALVIPSGVTFKKGIERAPAIIYSAGKLDVKPHISEETQSLSLYYQMHKQKRESAQSQQR